MKHPNNLFLVGNVVTHPPVPVTLFGLPGGEGSPVRSPGPALDCAGTGVRMIPCCSSPGKRPQAGGCVQLLVQGSGPALATASHRENRDRDEGGWEIAVSGTARRLEPWRRVSLHLLFCMSLAVAEAAADAEVD